MKIIMNFSQCANGGECENEKEEASITCNCSWQAGKNVVQKMNN